MHVSGEPRLQYHRSEVVPETRHNCVEQPEPAAALGFGDQDPLDDGAEFIAPAPRRFSVAAAEVCEGFVGLL